MSHKLLLIQSLINLSDLNWVRCRKFMHRAQYNFYIHACIVAPKKIQIFILLMSATLLVNIQAPSILAQFSPSFLALYCLCQGVQNKKDFMQNHWVLSEIWQIRLFQQLCQLLPKMFFSFFSGSQTWSCLSNACFTIQIHSELTKKQLF